MLTTKGAEHALIVSFQDDQAGRAKEFAWKKIGLAKTLTLPTKEP